MLAYTATCCITPGDFCDFARRWPFPLSPATRALARLELAGAFASPTALLLPVLHVHTLPHTHTRPHTRPDQAHEPASLKPAHRRLPAIDVSLHPRPARRRRSDRARCRHSIQKRRAGTTSAWTGAAPSRLSASRRDAEAVRRRTRARETSRRRSPARPRHRTRSAETPSRRASRQRASPCRTTSSPLLWAAAAGARILLRARRGARGRGPVKRASSCRRCANDW